MLNRVKCLAVIMIILACALYAPTAFAADSVRVFYSGQEIYYDVPPQIISERTMVPLRSTIETITGQPMNWDAQTRTVTFYANGRTNVHTIGQNVVYADGTPLYFDTPSLIIDSRTLVPVRMVAETAGCMVDWDAANRYVIITPLTAPAPTPQPQATQPGIISVSASRTTIDSGDNTVFTVKTNSVVNNVWVDDGRNNENALYKSADSTGVKTWTVTCSPTSSRNVTVYANTSRTTTNAASIAQYITVYNPNVSIVSISVNKTTINSGDNVTFTVRTSSTTNNVWAEYEGTSPNAKFQSAYSNGDKSWTVTCSPTSSRNVTIYANTSKKTTNAAYQSQYITVNSPAIAIVSLSANKSAINSGDNVTFTIRTSKAVNNVWAEYDNTSTNAAYQSSYANGEQAWSVTLFPRDTQSVRLYANANKTASGAASESYRITVNAVSYASVTSISASKTNVNPGDTVTITARTNSAATYAWLDTGSASIPMSYNSADSAGNKTWSASFSANNSCSVAAYASKSSQYGKDDSRSVSITVTQPQPQAFGEFVGFDIEPKLEHFKGDSVQITIYTNAAATKVCIFVDRQEISLTRITSTTWKTTVTPAETQLIYVNIYGSSTSSFDTSGEFRVDILPEPTPTPPPPPEPTPEPTPEPIPESGPVYVQE